MSLTHGIYQEADVDKTGWCLLSLDGGGVRGLSSLYMLKGVMQSINHRRQLAGLPAVKPCQLFDLMGGTSTGGLIAIMLGRLELDVEKCIEYYCTLIKTVFEQRSSWSPINWSANIRSQYSSKVLEGAIKEVLRSCSVPEDEQFYDPSKSLYCKVFVCAKSNKTAGTTIIRSYAMPSQLGIDPPPTIWQAALATAAATSFFKPVKIGNCQYIDGALGDNNPIAHVENEAKLLWSPDADLTPTVKCILSVGTGGRWMVEIPSNAARFVGALVRIATATEEAHDSFFQRWQHRGRYFRLNVRGSLDDVKLADYKRVDIITAATTRYFNEGERQLYVRHLAENLTAKLVGVAPRVEVIRIAAQVREHTALGRSGLKSLPRNVTSRNAGVLDDSFHCFNKALELVERTPGAVSSIEKARLYQKLSDTLGRRARVGDLDREQQSQCLDNARAYNTKMVELAGSLHQYPKLRLQARFERACLVAQEIEFEAQGRLSEHALLGLRRRRDTALADLSERLQELRDLNHENIATCQQQEEWYRRHLGII